MVLRRALETKRITRGEFTEHYRRELAESRRRTARGEGGGNFYATFVTRNGSTFAREVVAAAMEQRLLYREAAGLLGLKKVATLFSAAREFGLA